jgi:MFS family permease
MMLWGVLSCVTGAVKNYSGLLVCRFFLGFLEAAYFPGVVFLLSCWYTRKEIALRSALLFSGLMISGGFSGLISAGITHGMDGVMGYRAWYESLLHACPNSEADMHQEMAFLH